MSVLTALLKHAIGIMIFRHDGSGLPRRNVLAFGLLLMVGLCVRFARTVLAQGDLTFGLSGTLVMGAIFTAVYFGRFGFRMASAALLALCAVDLLMIGLLLADTEIAIKLHPFLVMWAGAAIMATTMNLGRKA